MKSKKLRYMFIILRLLCIPGILILFFVTESQKIENMFPKERYLNKPLHYYSGIYINRQSDVPFRIFEEGNANIEFRCRSIFGSASITLLDISENELYSHNGRWCHKETAIYLKKGI